MILAKEIEVDFLSMCDGFEGLNATLFKNLRSPKVIF